MNLLAWLRCNHGHVWIYGEQCRWWGKPLNVPRSVGQGRLWEEALPGVTRAIAHVRDPASAALDEIAKLSPFVGTLWLLAAPVMGADLSANWPQFRGPGALGVPDHPSLPERWSTNENIAWKAEVPGRGWSSPIAFRRTSESVFVPVQSTRRKNLVGSANVLVQGPR